LDARVLRDEDDLPRVGIPELVLHEEALAGDQVVRGERAVRFAAVAGHAVAVVALLRTALDAVPADAGVGAVVVAAVAVLLIAVVTLLARVEHAVAAVHGAEPRHVGRE